MKRVCLVLIICMTVLLSGCSAKEAIASDKQEYIVSSLGFDFKEEEITMIAEAIVINTDDLTSEKESTLIIGKGKNVDEAFSEITSQITQPLSLGHNGVTVIGESVTSAQLEDIFAFFKSQPQLNLATMLISTDSAEKLLSCEAVSSVAVGYDIMSMIEVNEEEKGTLFKNRLYETQALMEKPANKFWLPYISVNHDKFSLGGLMEFKGGKPSALLINDEIPIFCIVTDALKRGEIVNSGNKYKIKYSKVSYEFFLKNQLNITVNIRLKATGDISLLKSNTEKLLKRGDICALENIIYQKEPKIWKKIKSNFDEYYKNAIIRVNIYE